jgi:hypothetical protein
MALPPISPRIATPAPTPANAAAVRDARAMFFKALGEVPAAAPSTPVARPAFNAPAVKVAPAAASSPPVDPTQPRRPGSLLDIRV